MKNNPTVYLRAIKEEDMESIYRSCQDEETLYMTGTRTPFTLDSIRQSYQQFSQEDRKSVV